MRKRASGILLHITSLPGEHGIGDLGSRAYRFADFLAHAKQSYWQVLPLNALAPGCAGSPYSALSAFAANTLLISPELLNKQGLLSKQDMEGAPVFSEDKVDFQHVSASKKKLLDKAFSNFLRKGKDCDYESFCAENKLWLQDYAFFSALRQHFKGRPWYDWPIRFRDRKDNYLRSTGAEFQQNVEKEKFLQYIFFKQWFLLKQYCNERGICIIGDIPLYVGSDSADVWTHRRAFKLTASGKPRVVAGVPPDFFSKTGQRWGNPIYDWQYLRDNKYSWWVARMKHNLKMYDAVRIDHFLGLLSYWEIPSRRKDAIKGKWVDGPGEHFFKALFKHIPFAPIIVEDLGPRTVGAAEIIQKFRLPSMKVLQYAFDGDFAAGTHIPHNHKKDSVIYTGTHDNNTIRGWFENEASPQQKKNLFDYLGRQVRSDKLSWELIRLAMSSVSDLVIICMQDVLALGADARMNTPATTTGNWVWRMKPDQCTPKTRSKLAKLTEIYGRT